MHILTGLILANVLGKRRGGRGPLVTMFRTGPVRTAHWMPGRVRFRAAPLVADKQAGTLVGEKLAQVQGVEAVKVSSATGSVLIRYREDTVEPELLYSALVRLLGLEDRLQSRPQPALNREVRNIVESLNRAVYEQTGGLLDFWTAAMILLGALGIKRLATEGARGFPAGFTLVWWTLNSLLGRPSD